MLLVCWQVSVDERSQSISSASGDSSSSAMHEMQSMLVRMLPRQYCITGCVFLCAKVFQSLSVAEAGPSFIGISYAHL